jgi:hypothetical protein
MTLSVTNVMERRTIILLINTEIKIMYKEGAVTNFEIILDVCDEIQRIPRETSVTCAATLMRFETKISEIPNRSGKF